MKINPVSFNQAQRTCVLWQEPACFSQTADAERGGAGPGGRGRGARGGWGGGRPASQPPPGGNKDP